MGSGADERAGRFYPSNVQRLAAVPDGDGDRAERSDPRLIIASPAVRQRRKRAFPAADDAAAVSPLASKTKLLEFLTSVSYRRAELGYIAVMNGDFDYLSRRAREEREAAERATNEKVRGLHLELEARYLKAAGTETAHASPPEPLNASIAPPDFRIIQ